MCAQKLTCLLNLPSRNQQLRVEKEDLKSKNGYAQKYQQTAEGPFGAVIPSGQ